jgi:hypothetical protein
MNGKKAKAERREAKRHLAAKIAKAKELRILNLVGEPPTVRQVLRALRAQAKVFG